jgi:hypothetical protein
LRRPSFDTLLLFVLLIARARIDTLAEWAVIPRDMLQADVARLVGGWWTGPGLALLADRQEVDPVSLLLISLAFGLFLVYLVVDLLAERLGETRSFRLKMALVCAVVVVLVFGQAALFIGLRHISGPAAYTHDGGVIQTEVTIDYLLSGVNPYVADYLDTPMAAWGTEYRTALYHYPYLPWTFVFSAPFCVLSRALLGWYDQRFVYLALFALTLVLAGRLAGERRDQLGAVMVVGLNPILASDVIFGQNDSFVLFWIVLALWLLGRPAAAGAGAPLARALSAVAFGLACASKPTAWFMAPFWLLYLARDRWPAGGEGEARRASIPGLLAAMARRAWPLALVVVLVVGPWFVWDPAAMYDDVWRWSAGTAQAPYQIRGWGLSNFVLALGLVQDRLAYFPFWIPELLVGAPLLALLLWRQARRNRLPAVAYHYVALLFGFSYASRFLNENYLGYMLALLALAYFAERGE